MQLSKSLRIKIVLAVPYCLSWFLTSGFSRDFGDFPSWGNFSFYIRGEEWIAVLVPLALLFSTDIWRWIKSGSDD